MDITKLKAYGPWVLVKVDPPPEKSDGGVYLPQGNLVERLGHATGTVINVGQGELLDEKDRRRTGKKYNPIDLDPGMKVAFRGYLQDAVKPSYLELDHCLVHVDDIIGEVLPEVSVC